MVKTFKFYQINFLQELLHNKRKVLFYQNDSYVWGLHPTPWLNKIKKIHCYESNLCINWSMYSMKIGAKERGGGIYGQLHCDMVVNNFMLTIACFLSKLYLQGEVSHNGTFPTWGRGAVPQTVGQI